MQRLRTAMQNRDGNELFISIQTCHQLIAPSLSTPSARSKRVNQQQDHASSAHGSLNYRDQQEPPQYIRVLNEASALVTVLEEEEYVQSLANDLTQTSELHEPAETITSKGSHIHPVLVDYVIRIAETYHPSMDTGHLRKLRLRCASLLDEKHAQQERSHKNLQAQQEIRKQLWDGILSKDVESLMGTLALLDESTKDIKEQKLATVLAVRALEEKGAVEASMKTLEAVNKAISVVSKHSADGAIQTLHSSLKICYKKD